MYCLDNRLTAVRLSALRSGGALPSERSSGAHFCYRVSKPQGIVRLELGKLKKCNDFIGIRTCGLPACSTAPQLSTLPRAPNLAVGPRMPPEEKQITANLDWS
jgi:hypothetical protein